MTIFQVGESFQFSKMIVSDFTSEEDGSGRGFVKWIGQCSGFERSFRSDALVFVHSCRHMIAHVLTTP